MNKAIAGALLALSACGASSGVDGIAISHRATTKYPQPRFAPLMHYQITNDEVVDERVMYEGGARWPRFSPDGTRAAFFRADGDRRYLSVMSVDGGPVTDLASIDKNGGGILEWPIGPWIYFTTTSDRNDEEGKTLYRIDAENPADPEPVVAIDYVYWSGGMSADGSRGFFTYYRPGLYTMRFDGAAVDTSRLCEHNCGSAISPSGAYLAHFFDGSHYDFVLRQWPEAGAPAECLPDERQLIEYIRGDSLNRWGAATSRFSYTCDWTNAPTVTVGGGKMNRWSRNSDKWLSVVRGWPCGGRYDRCNSNQVLINWVDRKTIVVSGHGRTCGGRGQCCDIEDADGALYAEAGDFWVSGPKEDILPAFRQPAALKSSHARLTPPDPGVSIRFYPGAGPLTHESATGRDVYGIDGRLLRRTARPGPGIVIIHSAY